MWNKMGWNQCCYISYEICVVIVYTICNKYILLNVKDAVVCEFMPIETLCPRKKQKSVVSKSQLSHCAYEGPLNNN